MVVADMGTSASWVAAVLLLLLLCATVAHAQLYEVGAVESGSRLRPEIGEACRLNDGGQGVCRTPTGCPGLLKQINSGTWPKKCSFVNGQIIICCNSMSGSTPTTPARQTPPTRRTTTTVSTTTTKIPNSLSRVDESTKAGRKCREYASYVYWEEEEITLLPIPERHNKSECAMIDEELITGGVEAVAKEFPHMVGLGYGRKEDIKWICGGSLISERFVLTTAHCLQANHYGLVRWVRLGDLNLDRTNDEVNAVTMEVTERIRHNEYNPRLIYNDIALLKLNRDVTFSPYIRPACLYTRPGNPPGKLKATVSGWATPKFSIEEKTSSNLMKVHLEFWDESRCNFFFRDVIQSHKRLPVGITPESMICAGDPCGSFAGGPLQIRLESPDPFCMYSIIGLTSFGVPFCYAGDHPAVYTRVSNYISWIERHVWP